MNRNLHSPSSLTEFARYFDEEPENIFTKFVNKLTNAYNTSYNTVNDLQTVNVSSSPITGATIPIISPTPSGAVSPGNSNLLSIRNDNNTISRTSSLSSLNSNNIPNLEVTGDKSSTASTSTASSSASSSAGTSPTNDVSENGRKEVGESPIDAGDGRTMLNVLKRISNIVAAKNNNLRSYKDTELHKLWMPDSKAKECYDCGQKFSTFRRKHHCRLCGQIFCAKCCNQVVPGKIIMCSGDLKVCTYCSKIVLSYLKSPDITQDLKADLQALQDDLSNKLQNQGNDQNALEIRSSPVHRKISVGYQEERLVANQATSLSNLDRKNILQQSNSLKTLHDEMIQLVPSIQNCGTDLISFLISNQKSSNNVQAVAILNAMLEAGFLVPIVPDSDNVEFDENLHYRLVRKDDLLLQQMDAQSIQTENKNTNLLSGSFQDDVMQYEGGDLNWPRSLDGSISFQSVKEAELENSIRSTTNTTQHLLKVYCDHEELLLNQLLRSQNLDENWSKILITLCARVVNQFKPEYCTNELMDIRNYVSFKKVPGGSRTDCTIIGGVVFSKNVAHKEMATRIEKPRILLLQCPIVYERIEGKFVSIETLLLQEKEYLRNVVSRILNLKPNVVLVHKNVAGVAQDMLRSHGITLVLDVKMSVMERLERCLRCDIVTSIESNIGRPKLGTCDNFYIKSFDDGKGSSKNLMFFELLSNPRVFCCLLRGGTNPELAHVKKVASLLTYARYNWRLEMAFLLDEFAKPPSTNPLIFDSREHSPSDKDDIENEMKGEITTAKSMSRTQLREDLICHEKNETEKFSEQNIESSQIVHKRLQERKSEDKLVTIENVNDFSDPLRALEFSPTKYEADNTIQFEVQIPYDNRFKNALNSTILSVSPFVNFPLPYLETEQGRKCPLRSLFPKELYFSKQWSDNVEKPSSHCEIHNQCSSGDDTIILKSPHKFIHHKITKPFNDPEIQSYLAEYRAFGGRYPRTTKMVKKMKRQQSYQQPQKAADDQIFKDALDLENHQRLPVLFCSFYYNPKASSFCAQPTLLDMKFYGQQDIMLGQFLQRYCFRSSYICQSCNLPMMDHVRRYVHSMGCVHVSLVEDTSKNDNDKIFITCWCSICNETTPSVPLSEDTRCLSFAKYLELRFHAHVYKKRALDSSDIQSTADNNGNKEEKETTSSATCNHSLHRDYIHYFSYKGIGAKFVYSPVDIWEISIPPLVLMLRKPKPFNNNQVLEDIKSFSMKGHEVYSQIHEKIAELSSEEESTMLSNLKMQLNRDQFAFRQKVEIVQTLLVEENVHSYDINDAMLMAKRTLGESIELWGPRLEEATVQVKSLQKQDSVSSTGVDAGTVCTEDLKSADISGGSESDINSENKMGRDIAANEDDKGNLSENNQHSTQQLRSSISSKSSPYSGGFSGDQHHAHHSDKKSIKQILSQLLPSTGQANYLQSPLSGNQHLTLPLGAFPILVDDQDMSSIIAFSLTSDDYKKSIENPVLNYASDTNNSPNVKRKSQDGLLENEEKESGKNEEERKTKTNSHIELYFQDLTTSFTCKIYFAREFDTMRANILKPPKLDKSKYKELESKKREELRTPSSQSSQKCSTPNSSNDNLLDAPTRKTPLNNLTPAKGISPMATPLGAGLSTPLSSFAGTESPSNKDLLQNQNEIEETRVFFARSLCRSIPWEARGGKSGSKFRKTLDDRFVLKEMSKTDITIFENFASNYFEYINKCLQQNQPTLLVKILGVYRVTIKNKDMIHEKTLLVMENLFYGSEIRNKFDLKGSERNRLVDPTNQNGGDIVLLDENLIQMSWFKPIYILSHSKTILREAINRDSSFLERNDVMDYSLLVGLNNKDRTLVLGIIDYIRTYTLDKKLESIVKQSGLLGGQGKLPTVISPQRYKQRFIEAMDRYFYSVPDRWEGLSKK